MSHPRFRDIVACPADRICQVWIPTRGASPCSLTQTNGRGDVDSFTSSSTRTRSLVLTVTSVNTPVVSSHVYPSRLKTSFLTPNCAYLFLCYCTYPSLTSVLLSVTGALIMDITYGLDIKSHEDPFLQAAERAMECAKSTMIPGAFLVDTFPIRSSVPPPPCP